MRSSNNRQSLTLSVSAFPDTIPNVVGDIKTSTPYLFEQAPLTSLLRLRMTGSRPNHRCYERCYEPRILPSQHARDRYVSPITLQYYRNDYSRAGARAHENHGTRAHDNLRETVKEGRNLHDFREMRRLMLLRMRARTVRA